MTLFGTDGIRGTANTYPMTAEVALKLGMAAGAYFTRATPQSKGHRHVAVIGKDTRLSGYMLEPALTAGLIASGMDVVLAGPLPTPAVAMLVRSMRADLGIMISASHNPYYDNGLKLFGPDGYKLAGEAEAEIERLIFSSPWRGEVQGGGAGFSSAMSAAKGGTPTPPSPLQGEGVRLASPDTLGRARRLEDARGRYIEYAKATFPKHLALDGMKIVLDCANGAAYQVGPLILSELGAEVYPLGVSPDGFNINRECGSTAPEALCRAVLQEGAHAGIALDGDADRVLMCDEKGRVIDGDSIMALIATSWAKRGLLKGGAVIATHMSNLSLERYVQSLGLALERTDIGDRHVVERMRERGCNLGGEQSGHIILSDHTTTGDGLIAALQVLAVLAESRAPLSAASNLFTPLPQLLKNIPYTGPSPLTRPEVQTAIAEAQVALTGRGRLLVRASGTEPLIRVMVEGENELLIRRTADDIYNSIACTL